MCGNADQSFNELISFYDSFIRSGFTNLYDMEMAQTVGILHHKTNSVFPKLHLLNVAAGASFSILQRVLERAFPGRGSRLSNALLAGKGEITSAAHGYRLMEMAGIVPTDPDAALFFSPRNYEPLLWESRLPEGSRFKAMFRGFLKEYGHRAVCKGESEPIFFFNLEQSLKDRMGLMMQYVPLAERIESFWLERANQEVPSFLEHGNINEVMLATSLVPDGYLKI